MSISYLSHTFQRSSFNNFSFVSLQWESHLCLPSLFLIYSLLSLTPSSSSFSLIFPSFLLLFHPAFPFICIISSSNFVPISSLIFSVSPLCSGFLLTCILPLFLPIFPILPLQMSSLFPFLLPRHSLVALPPLFPSPGLPFHLSVCSLLFHTSCKCFSFAFHLPLCDFFSFPFLLSSFPIYLALSLPLPLLHPSLSRHPLVNLFIFFLSRSLFPSLSLIHPNVFCSIYYLDETLPQFITHFISTQMHTRKLVYCFSY